MKETPDPLSSRGGCMEDSVGLEGWSFLRFSRTSDDAIGNPYSGCDRPPMDIGDGVISSYLRLRSKVDSFVDGLSMFMEDTPWAFGEGKAARADGDACEARDEAGGEWRSFKFRHPRECGDDGARQMPFESNERLFLLQLRARSSNGPDRIRNQGMHGLRRPIRHLGCEWNMRGMQGRSHRRNAGERTRAACHRAQPHCRGAAQISAGQR
ncbi:MAG: hypothetical protein J0M09_13015 [Xanthomonadales bacterium]|nr:hypothetical protein [Xanthomonadales bacterium]